jgi:drug/metabolite transporter (DMT)-like permease
MTASSPSSALRRVPLAGGFCLFVAAAIWGGMYVVSKAVLDYIPPMTLLALRLAIGAVALGIGMLVARASFVRLADCPRFALLGCVGFGVSLGAQFVGTRMSSAAHGAVLTSITPAGILLFAVLLLQERLRVRKMSAVGIASLGVLLVVGAPGSLGLDWRTVGGDLLLLLAGLTWALYTVLCRLAANRYPPVTVTTYAMLFGLLCVAPFVPLEWETINWERMPAAVWWGVAYLGIVSTAVAFYLWNKGFTMLDPASGSLFFFAQPVVGALLGWLLLDETLGLQFLLGTGVIIAAGVIAGRETG